MTLPQQFGRYELRELIGRGGMGEVYRAFDTVRDRTVALKVLPDYLAGDASFDARFRRESRMAAKLNEPHIIPIHDFGEIDGKLFLDMRLVEGHDLGSVLETRGTLEPAVAVDIIGQTASALDAAHASGLVHRDVKPSNILLTGLSDDPHALPFAYLVDFGIARSAQQEGTALTATTATVGTVAYMSPERIAGKPSDLRTDVYALACVLFETLTGRKPFDGEMFAQMYAHMNAPAPLASSERPGVPAALDAVITKGMAKDPDDRYASTGALATAARAALHTALASGPTAPLRGQPAPPAVPPPSQRPQPSQPQPAHPQLAQPSHPQQWTPPPPPRNPTAPLAPTPSPGPPPPVRVPNRPSDAPPPGGPAPGRPPTYGAPPSRPDRSRRRLVAALLAVVVIAAAIGIAFAVTRGGGSGHQADPTPPPTGSSGAPTTSTNSGGNQASAAWSQFSSFSKLLGTKNGDTAHAFNRGSCSLNLPDTADAKDGVLSEVKCTYPGTSATVVVAQFDGSTHLRTYMHNQIFKQAHHELVWTTGGQPRGLALISPQTGSGVATITTAICGLPTYLVEVGAPDRTAISTQTLHDDIWNKATFPDTTPPACDTAFTGIASGSTSSASTGPAKGVAPMGTLLIQDVLQRGDSTVDVVQVPTSAGVDIMTVRDNGGVSFWQEASDSVARVGASSYPYKPGTLGSPEAVGSGAVLTNMSDATFVVHGNFSGDGSGNAVAFTNGPQGWGAIKGEASGNELVPSGEGVSVSGIGLSNDFDLVGGRLETFDCSSTLPISECGGQNRVIKYWTWMTDHFVQTGSAGLSS